MGHHSKIKKIVALRGEYTGETYQEAMRHVAATQTLGPLLDVWSASAKHDFAGQPGDLSAVERLLRGIVLPDTTDRDQQCLEASLLLAVHDCQPQIGHDDGNVYQGHRVFASVSPSRDMLAISVHEDTVERFIRSLLPPLRPVDGATGIPGLRLVPTRRHLIVRQFDQRNHLTRAKVALKWVGDLRWRRIWGTACEHDEWPNPVDPVLARNHRLSPGERAMFDSYRHSCRPIALGSAMLRRFGLVKDAFSIDTWTTGGRTLNVEIERGPSIYSLVCALQHPIVGILRGSVAVDHTPGPLDPGMTFARLIDPYPAPETRPAGQPRTDRPPSIALRTLSDYGSYPAQPPGRTERTRVRGGS